jgi:hypothetical protein
MGPLPTGVRLTNHAAVHHLGDATEVHDPRRPDRVDDGQDIGSEAISVGAECLLCWPVTREANQREAEEPCPPSI